MNTLAILVNTSDGFEDCWTPFFHLFIKYGGGLSSAPLYLNTERKDFSFDGLSLRSTKVWPANSPRPTWSECLSRALDLISEPYVLYLQEDYFLERPVNFEWIQKSIEMLKSDRDVGVIYLNRYGPQFKRCRERAHGFVEIQAPVSYLLSTQAAIWRKDTLATLIRPWENGWMFEKFGSLRARRINKTFLSINPGIMVTSPAIDYIYTGVMKGQWNQHCPALFQREGIQTDFGKRGFYAERGRMKSKWEVLQKLLSNPSRAIRSMMSVF